MKNNFIFVKLSYIHNNFVYKVFVLVCKYLWRSQFDSVHGNTPTDNLQGADNNEKHVIFTSNITCYQTFILQ